MAIDYPLQLETTYENDFERFADEQIANAGEIIEITPQKENTNYNITAWLIAATTATIALNQIILKRGEEVSQFNIRNIKQTLQPHVFDHPFTYGTVQNGRVTIPVSAFKDLHLNDWAARNVNLIKNITQEHAREISQIVRGGFVAGKSAKDIERALKLGEAGKAGVYDKFKNRARLIARDQVGKLHSQMTQNRLSAMGVNFYFWMTQGDQRVREAHQALNGQKFSWANPSSEGHPGEPIGCRCYPDPVIQNKRN